MDETFHEPEAVTDLRLKLALLPSRLGFARLALVPVYNDQHHSISIMCEGGRLEQRQKLIARLAEMRPAYEKPVFAYADVSNPQINFNGFDDAVKLVDAFALTTRGAAQAMSIRQR